GLDVGRPGVPVLTPREAKGLEFDAVVVVEPARMHHTDLYVALTRATQRLDVVHTGPLSDPPFAEMNQGAAEGMIEQH
uniref:ATP-binding domain-containing protein n=1 Tax=Pseudonocardia pini TaxID=2758030 RepID=UPI0015F0F071